MSAKKLPPPKGSAGAASAAASATATPAEIEASRIDKLSSRYQQEQAGQGGQSGPSLSWSQSAGRPAESAPAPAAAPARATRARRTEPDGMTRRTYYLADDAAHALDAAVERIQRATGGNVSKHAALGALIAAGVEQTDTVLGKLRDELIRNLAAAE
jgi:hypothetical protein